jgi:hypothetical protein
MLNTTPRQDKATHGSAGKFKTREGQARGKSGLEKEKQRKNNAK